MRPVGSFFMTANYTYQNTEDLLESGPLLRRPEHKGSLNLDYLVGKGLRLGAQAIFTGSQKDGPVEGFGEENPAWTRVDMNVSYTVKLRSTSLEIFSRINNLFDEEYSEVLGYPAPGINVFVGARIGF